MGAEVRSEEESNSGRLDAVLETPKTVYIMEFKMGSASEAMAQIKEKKYHEKYLLQDKENIFGECNYDYHVGNALVSFHDCTNLFNNHIKLSNIGDIIKHQLNNISDQFKNVKIDEYIIIPNHVHLILIINKKDEASASPTVPQIIRSLKSRCAYQYLEYIKENL